MADQETQDRAIQTRIIKHMNADHHDSVSKPFQPQSLKRTKRKRND